MRLGFTGTRSGMTKIQADVVAARVSELRPSELHHGDCMGADEEFHGIAFSYRAVLPASVFRPRVVGHPPLNEQFRAFCDFDEMREPKNYLERNREIVNETDILIAAPARMAEPSSLRGQGTWTTVAYARAARKPRYIIFPDGTIRDETYLTPAPSQADGLLRAWRACMTEPRPSDWEQIVTHLLEDTNNYL